MKDKIDIIENKILNNLKLTEIERKYCAWGKVGEYVDKIEKSNHRQTREMQTIFKIGEQYYAIDYHVIDWMSGLTEMQDNECWDDPYKVERKEEVITKTVIKYVPMEE